MDEITLKRRFKKFALDIFKLTGNFPKSTIYFIIEKQIIRAASSSAANYHAACRAKSKPDFINKLKIVEEELDETVFWLDFLTGVDIKWTQEANPLMNEGNELLAIIVSSINTTRKSLADAIIKSKIPIRKS